ncbi:MAG: thiamine-phosphate kinase, partial [Thermodesulfovibrionales bacterium]|nr:thiamine-phosphate kinase [Thermodesulfovibrionales bacterium]
EMCIRDSFDRSYTSPYSLGQKIVSVNVSDIYATGGEPVAIFISLSLPKEIEEEFFWDFYDGLQYALSIYDLDLLGGDLCANKNDISINATVIGYTDKPIYRSDAKVGDLICVTGFVGDSAMGLHLLQSLNTQHKKIFSKNLQDNIPKNLEFFKEGKNIIIETNSALPCINRHLMPIARDGKEIYQIANSMIDLSDGLYLDLQRLCNESKVGAKIYNKHLPLSKEMIHCAKILGVDALTVAISGGEDFELLFTIPKDKPLPKISDYQITIIGEIISQGIHFIDQEGKTIEVPYKGYEHFSQ